MEFSGDGLQIEGRFFNGEERETPTRGWLGDGKLRLEFEHYATVLEAVWKGGTLEGRYSRPPSSAYPFRAKRFVAHPTAEQGPAIAGTWEVPVKSPKGESAWRLIVR